MKRPATAACRRPCPPPRPPSRQGAGCSADLRVPGRRPTRLSVTCAPTGFSTEVGRPPAAAGPPPASVLQHPGAPHPVPQILEEFHLHPTAASAHTKVHTGQEVYTRSHRTVGALDGHRGWAATPGEDRAGKVSVAAQCLDACLCESDSENGGGRAQSRQRAATRPRGTTPRGGPTPQPCRTDSDVCEDGPRRLQE